MKNPGKTLLELVMPNSKWEDQTPETQSRWLTIAARVIRCDCAGDFHNDLSIKPLCDVIEEQARKIAEFEKRFCLALDELRQREDLQAEVVRLKAEVEMANDRINAAFRLIAEEGCDCEGLDRREKIDDHECFAGRMECALKGLAPMPDAGLPAEAEARGEAPA